MPANVTPVAGWPTIQTPVNGDAGDAGALLTTTIQPVADRIERLRSRVIGGGAGYELTVPGGAPDRVSGTVLYTVPVISGGVGTTATAELLALDSAAAYTVEWWYRLPNGAAIEKAKISIQGIAGSARPTNMPRMRIIKQNTVGLQTVVADVVDPSATDATFRNKHEIYAAGLALTVYSGEAIALVLTAAASTAGQDDLRILESYLGVL